MKLDLLNSPSETTSMPCSACLATTLGDRASQLRGVGLFIELLAALAALQDVEQRWGPRQASDVRDEDPVGALIHPLFSYQVGVLPLVQCRGVVSRGGIPFSRQQITDSPATVSAFRCTGLVAQAQVRFAVTTRCAATANRASGTAAAPRARFISCQPSPWSRASAIGETRSRLRSGGIEDRDVSGV